MPSVSKRRSRAWLGLALGAMLAGWTATAQAFFGFGLIPGIYVPQTYYKFGAVYTRAIVLNANGNKVWVEYGSDGKEAREIGEAIGPLEQAQVMSGDIYRAYQQRLKDTRERYPQSEVMTAATYRGTAFKTVDGKVIDKPSLSPSSLSVLVRGEKERFSTKGDELLLLQLPIDSNVTPSSSSKALLLSKEGQILHQGTNSIGFRVGFFGKDGKVEDKMYRDRDAKIYGPLPGVGVTLGSHVTGGYALTDEEGKYRMNYFLPPCPGFFFEYTTPSYLELYYKRFNPRGSSNMPYYLTRPDYDTCNGMGLWSLEAAAIVATIATPMKQAADFPIDLMVLDGSAQFGDGVKLAGKTAYSDKTGTRDHYLQEKYDFDGDDKPDWVAPGKKVTKEVEGKQKEVFVKTSLEEAELQGIYLSSRFDGVPADTEKTAPDFTRLIDVAPDMENRGLLESISKDDLKDTDIYVFRESNGQLVAERRGLHEDELYKNYSGVDEKAGSFRYTIQLRGSKENNYAITGRTGEAAFSKWQSAGGFKEEFQKRAANHLKAGETVRIIAINRPTGYMGSVKFQLESATASGNLLNFADQRIELAPPNLKVWAERKNKIEKGMTSGEVKKHLIGSEGAALGSDISIAIYTDWRDVDGGALPEELADYGYTGRLAKVVAANQLAPVGANSLSQFKIKPGQQVQVIQLPEKVLAKQHLYLQVAGQPDNRNPDFSSNGQAGGVLKYRPTHFVPVRVPLHDEEASELAKQAYYRVDKQVRESLGLKSPEPLYAWNYRPELQFSLYDLNVKAMRRADADGKISNILDSKKPTLAGSDKYVALIYDLLKSAIDPLAAWSFQGDRDLVFALGEQEVKATIGKDQSIKLENLEHLGRLRPEDYLTLRLYANNDVGNTLYEFAFEYLAVDTTDPQPEKWNGDFYEVSADKPEVGLQAWLLGFESRNSGPPKPVSIWSLEGSGYLKQPGAVTGNEAGYFENKLTMPTTAGSTATITVYEEGDSAKAKFGTVRVVPGDINKIELKQEGYSSAFESGETSFTALLTDKYGNRMPDGTTVDWTVNGDARLKSFDLVTTNGISKAVVLGGGRPGEAKISATSGSVSQSVSTEIKPLDVSISGPGTVRPGELFEVRVLVKDSEGKPVSDLFFLPSSSVGRVEKDRVLTDASGTASFRVLAGQKESNGTVGVSIGEQRKILNIQVKEGTSNRGGTASRITESAVLIGDRVQPGTVAANWFEQVNVDVPFEVSGEITVKGAPDKQVMLKLGSAGIPALAPIVSYSMGHMFEDGRVPDSIGRADGAAQFVDVVRDAPLGIGTSYGFKKFKDDEGVEQSSTIKASLTGLAIDKENLEFRVDLKLLETGGTVVEVGDGYSVSSDASGRLSLFAKTETQEVTLQTVPLDLNAWHNLVVRYADGALTLQINSANGFEVIHEYTASLRGPLALGEHAMLQVGGGLVGRLKGLEVFNSKSEKIVTFENGSDERLVQLDENGQAKVKVKSTGVFGTGVTEDASVSRIQKLPITLGDGSATSYITVMTLSAFKSTAEMQVSNEPIPDDAIASLSTRPRASTAAISVPAIFRVANAGFWDWVPSPQELKAAGEKALEYTAEAATWIVPYDDVLIIAEQLEYFKNNDPRYNVMLLTASSLSVLSVIPTPFTKALKPIMKPIKALAKIVGQGKFGVAFGKKFLALARGCVDEKGKGAACKTLQALLPFIETVGYMYLSDRDTFNKILTAIESEEDFLTLFEFLTMDIDPEWFGVTIPSIPDVADASTLNSLGIRVAHASSKDYKKFAGGVMAMLKKMSPNMSGKEVFGAIRPIVKLKDFLKTRPATLKLLVNVKAMQVFAVVAKHKGMDFIIGMVKGYNGQRIPQPIVWGMMYYLLVEKYKDFSPALQAKLISKMGIAFFDIGAISAAKMCNVEPAKAEGNIRGKLTNANGALYQLSQMAGFLLLGERVVDLERPIPVDVYKTVKGQRVKVAHHGREIDIVIEKGGKDVFVEVKSYAGKKGNTDVGSPRLTHKWKTVDQKGSFPMKEFFLDQIIVGAKEPEKKLMWRFDNFKVKDKECGAGASGSVSGFDTAVLAAAWKNMAKTPEWFKTAHAKAMFDAKSAAIYQAEFAVKIPAIVNNYGIYDLVLEGAMDKYLPGAKEEIEKAIGEL